MDNFMEYGWEDEIVNEGGDFVLLPEGDYDFTVAKYERARHEGSAKVPPCNMAKVTFTIWSAEDSVEIPGLLKRLVSSTPWLKPWQRP